MKILFVGESWLGSCARSVKEALAAQSDVEIDEVNEDLYFPKHRARWIRALHRFMLSFYRQELFDQVVRRIGIFQPDVLVVYKGGPFSAEFIRRVRKLGLTTVNIYPDCSPHAHGARHRLAVGAYDLVISTKTFHRALWNEVYKYSNACAFVPQGYDAALHLVSAPPRDQPFDVVLVATWRPEYGDLMKRVADLLAGRGIRFAIGGNGWRERAAEFPAEWILGGEMQGRSYIDWLRRGKICIAPVTREVSINGVSQPGDEDTTRTYELAAAHCFFIHRRTDFVKSLYDESDEVPMYDTPEELAEKIVYYLARPDQRQQMSLHAHLRAVPAYSVEARAKDIVSLLKKQVPVLSASASTP